MIISEWVSQCSLVKWCRLALFSGTQIVPYRWASAKARQQTRSFIEDVLFLCRLWWECTGGYPIDYLNKNDLPWNKTVDSTPFGHYPTEVVLIAIFAYSNHCKMPVKCSFHMSYDSFWGVESITESYLSQEENAEKGPCVIETSKTMDSSSSWSN